MSLPDKKLSKNSQDIRLAATQKIWSLAIGMFAICIPLSNATNSGAILPITVVVGATLGTASVWRASTKESMNNSQVSGKIKQLEERVANLETIITSENINWQSLIESSPKNAVLNEDSSSIEEIEQPK